MSTPSSKVVIIGAGIGGLAAARRLSHQGCDVTVLDMHDSPGGKMRTMPSAAGPVDAGPTVLTMRPVFEELFADVEETLADHLTLKPLEILARHYWDDGASLDLTADKDQSRDNIVDAFGIKAAAEFTAFSARAKRLFDAYGRTQPDGRHQNGPAATQPDPRNGPASHDGGPAEIILQ